jgi:hypothetical protein
LRRDRADDVEIPARSLVAVPGLAIEEDDAAGTIAGARLGRGRRESDEGENS